MENVIGKTASYMNYRGKITEVWEIKDKHKTMNLAKIEAGDSTYAVLNLDIVKIE
jgi:hypothetical protein